MSGPATGATGIVSGKHGGVDHVLVDFDSKTLHRLNIGDKIQIYSCGLGLRLPEFPQVTVTNCAPGLFAALGATSPTRDGVCWRCT